jgi:hypothetical protein
MDAGSHPITSQVSLENLCSAKYTEESVDARTPHTNMDKMDPLPITEAIRIKRHTDVSRDPRYTLQGPRVVDYDAECTAAPSIIPPWVFPAKKLQALFEEGQGTTPDLTYARRVPDAPDPCQTNFDKKCTLILIKIGFSRNLGCDK